jgi:hypothetical protein
MDEGRDSLVVLHTFTYRHEAELAHSVLEAFEVPSVISADDLGGEGLGTDLMEGVRLLVRSEDIERARDALKIRRPEQP